MGGPQPAAIGTSAQFLALVVADQHRAGDQHDGRHIGTGSGHQLGRHGFVATTDQHDGIHRLGADHFLGIHRHQIAQEHRGRVGKALMDRDGREGHRQAAGQHHSALHGLDQLRHIAVAGVVIAERIGNADDRPLQRIIAETHGLDKSPPQKQRKTGITITREPLAHTFGHTVRPPLSRH